jgi:A/G-specific adenine glycosylase
LILKNPKQTDQYQNLLLQWFENQKRDLPFRKDRDPYKIWISEIMLQQTRVGAMIPLFEKFINRFPDTKSIVDSNDEEVVRYWKGLGYYSRARNIRKAALILQTRMGGNFPKDLEEMKSLPGIGEYTARAVLSQAYHLPLAVVDGNVKRVVSRLVGIETSPDTKEFITSVQEFADGFLNHKNPGDHNQAIMELGSVICLPKNPKCLLCPIKGGCIAYSQGKQSLIPKQKNKLEKINTYMEFFMITKNEKILLIKDPNLRFLSDMFLMPYFVSLKDKNPHYAERWKEYKGEMVGEGSHSITHHKIKFSIKKIPLEGLNWEEDLEHKWVEKEEFEESFPSGLAKKIMKLIQKYETNHHPQTKI